MISNQHLTSEIERLAKRYGAIAVRQHANRICKATVGNKNKLDETKLMNEFEQDAREWLSGKESAQIFKDRSSYSISLEFEKKWPSPYVHKKSIQKRVERKLGKKREEYLYILACWIAESEKGYEIFFTAAKHAAQFKEPFDRLATHYQSILARYREVFGDPPVTMTVKEISEALVPPRSNFLGAVLLGSRANWRRIN